ncbi:MAG: hypothetical protein KJ945_02255 [Gammaproteobacteria bacterium]|nr:hypothetical protein [Gammaproteobacteria bacterium]
MLEALEQTPRQAEDRHVEASLTFEMPYALGCGSASLLARKIAHDIRRLEIMMEKERP